MNNTKEMANGRWPGILRHFGLADEFMVDRHGPCPLCGGDDRYRFDDKDGNGEYFCNQCGPGDGFDLLQKLLDLPFGEVAKRVDAIIGNIPKGPPGAPPHDPEKARQALRETWRYSVEDAPYVRAYLADRGLDVYPKTLRGHPGLSYYHAKRRLGVLRAMIAMVTGADGSAQSIHRTFLSDLFEIPVRKKMMTPVTTIAGGAIRLYPEANEMAVAEGIETALAVHEMKRIPVWSTVSAGGLKTVVLPQLVTVVHIFADNDENGTGQAAAYEAAARFTKEGRRPIVHVPEQPGDWLDVLRANKGLPPESKKESA
jgi:putative DNA primase/helicase